MRLKKEIALILALCMYGSYGVDAGEHVCKDLSNISKSA